ncbi:peptidase M15 [Gordonia iterans]|uniref:Peptidase M15 n=1 Tax=Gordonia iterans TaxID=1004901 RepID=A0A2S0KGU0_9ACTN|nr:peptidase M15 [Gordonia iterans]
MSRVNIHSARPRRRLLRLLSLGAAGAVAAGLAAAPASADPVQAAPASTQRAQLLGIPLAAGTAGLATDLAVAYTLAERDARAAGVPLRINSGKRSRAEQAVLWREGLRIYGSPGAARRWVLPPTESTHVTGEAIDVAPRAGAAWLQRHGYRWGLCRTFDNEWWHFERQTLPGTPCPPRWADASVRPRR